jgi:hypothetical protein
MNAATASDETPERGGESAIGNLWMGSLTDSEFCWCEPQRRKIDGYAARSAPRLQLPVHLPELPARPGLHQDVGTPAYRECECACRPPFEALSHR